MLKISLHSSLFYYRLILVSSILLLFSCKKDEVIIITPTTSAFTLRDTLLIQPQYQTGPFSNEYNRYNGKFYSVNSSNKVSFSAQKDGNNIEFSFVDSSLAKLYPSFSITVKNTQFENLAAQYSLTSSSDVAVKTTQTFIDGSTAISLASDVINGILNIKYNNSLKTLTGEINHLKIPLEYFTQEDISSLKRSSNGILIKNGGSTRTVSLKFNDVKIK